jgi:predicted TIM-barrel fold metal-dependent hydrolase
MIPACLPPRDVSRPKVPPPDACDTHAHVFGPAQRFAYTGDRSYTPPDAPLDKYLGMLDAIGFARGVLVQGSAHGCDNSAMLDALERRPDRLRGVAVADGDILPADLRAWDRLGVRGLRFNHFFRDGQLHYRGGVPLGQTIRRPPHQSRRARLSRRAAIS